MNTEHARKVLLSDDDLKSLRLQAQFMATNTKGNEWWDKLCDALIELEIRREDEQPETQNET